MKTFRVRVERTTVEGRDFTVAAETEEEALELALAEAREEYWDNGETDFDTHEAEEIPAP